METVPCLMFFSSRLLVTRSRDLCSSEPQEAPSLRLLYPYDIVMMEGLLNISARATQLQIMCITVLASEQVRASTLCGTEYRRGIFEWARFE